MTYDQDLAAHLKEFRSAPFLFVGSGMSRRYLGLETWAGLLERFSEPTGKPYAYYASSGDGQLPRVAGLLASAFHRVWWDDDEFEDARDKHQADVTTRSSPLKFAIADHVNAAVKRLPAKGVEGEELDLLRAAVIDGVITTNYDGLMEKLFADFKVFVGQSELLFSDPQGVGEIYKIHGSASDPNTLVLTDEDYEAFGDRNPYLAAKLLAIFVEHPVLFLGYSLSDSNVAELLVSVARCLTTEHLAKLQDRLIFVQWDPDVETSTLTATAISVEGFTIPVISVKVADFRDTFRALGSVDRKFPARLLRQLKEHIYDLVLTNEPTGRLYVQDIEEMDGKTLDVVVGVGIQDHLMGEVGYLGLERKDLLLDVLEDESEYDADRMVDEVLPVVLRRPGNVPVYRYLRGADLLTQAGKVRARADVDERIQTRVDMHPDALKVSPSVKGRADRAVKDAGNDLSSLIAHNRLTDALTFAAAIPTAKLNLEELRDFLVANKNCLTSDTTMLSTPWAKLVCYYDYLKFGVSA